MKRVGVKPGDVNRSLPYECVMLFHWHQKTASALTIADAWANARAERVKDKESVQKARGMMKMGSAIFSRSDLRSQHDDRSIKRFVCVCDRDIIQNVS